MSPVKIGPRGLYVKEVYIAVRGPRGPIGLRDLRAQPQYQFVFSNFDIVIFDIIHADCWITAGGFSNL